PRRAAHLDPAHPGGARDGGARALRDRRGGALRLMPSDPPGPPKTPEPLDLRGVRTYPLADRKSKVGLAQFGRPHVPGATLSSFLDSLHRILAGESLRQLVSQVHRARAAGKPILWGLGAHVLKVG